VRLAIQVVEARAVLVRRQVASHVALNLTAAEVLDKGTRERRVVTEQAQEASMTTLDNGDAAEKGEVSLVVDSENQTREGAGDGVFEGGSDVKNINDIDLSSEVTQCSCNVAERGWNVRWVTNVGQTDAVVNPGGEVPAPAAAVDVVAAIINVAGVIS